ncbi:ZYRO0D03564p [Zygosaccharomyces rouxii]|uniref:ZYRO0D03564p n=1 Tax=Zygosaccharomyces rouxii (strain ATCC 2623 / CBS 732 / NBRC 1130 / NCYC 568 / NRRL Y-229) TaxID=559307 RepID=C5DV36_ZYGRC|nr:uncharacterized protein ZYRO0D03564g [Zygosaccharomyces rouxii]KAH9200569.1 hypothetical protein LQ764DRAFT_233857 [Zygosaccharomyces rouxii]CAR27655.1 ZYRO0D03564p [Zygosaccharomyces rouxii]
MTKPRQRRSSASLKVVVDKDMTDKFARNSPTLSHLYRYPLLANGVDSAVNLPLVNVVLSWVLLLADRSRSLLLDSQKAPRFIKVGYNLVAGTLYKIDELFALLVLREGLGVLVEQWKIHGNKPGLWFGYFLVDYWANVVNILLTHFVLGPKKLAATPVILPTTPDDEQHSLPHLEELATTTKGISKDLQEKIPTGYLEKTASYARTKYEKLFKPVAERVQTEYVDPTKAHALDTYKTVSSSYGANLRNSESIPRAIVSTGIDLKNITLENLKTTTAEVVEEESKKLQEEAQTQVPKLDSVPVSNGGNAE